MNNLKEKECKNFVGTKKHFTRDMITELFILAQTEAKLKREMSTNIRGENEVQNTVEKTILKDIEGIELDRSEENISKFEKEQFKRLKNTKKKLMLDE